MLGPGIDQRRFLTDQLPSIFRIAFDFAVNLEDNNNCLQKPAQFSGHSRDFTQCICALQCTRFSTI